MENKNKVFLIFLILVVILLGGYLVYDKFISDSKCETCKECEICKECTYPNNTSNSYSFYLNNLINERTQSIIKIENNEISEPLDVNAIEIKTNGDAYLSLSNNLSVKYGTSYKALSKVLAAYVKDFGNGGYRS